jgi:hypothetical protein
MQRKSCHGHFSDDCQLSWIAGEHDSRERWRSPRHRRDHRRGPVEIDRRDSALLGYYASLRSRFGGPHLLARPHCQRIALREKMEARAVIHNGKASGETAAKGTSALSLPQHYSPHLLGVCQPGLLSPYAFRLIGITNTPVTPFNTSILLSNFLGLRPGPHRPDPDQSRSAYYPRSASPVSFIPFVNFC